MIIRNDRFRKILIVGIVVLFMAAFVVFSKVATDHEQNQITIESEDEIHTGKVNNTTYDGRLRVYVVEPVSRWMMKNGELYHFGFLGFAFNDNISIDPQDTFQKSITWDGDVTEENVMVIAVVSNSEQHPEYVSPPSDKPFKAYYTDATAAATPGNTGYNTVTTNFTHTVFVEEVTATWCPYCPSMGQALYAIYESGDYPWYFAALVYDMNSQAAERRDEYNVYGIPLAFFDGGYKVLQGEHSSETEYRPLIQACGSRQVPALNLSASVTYNGDGNLQITIAITNENLPPSTQFASSDKVNGSVN